MLALLRPAIQAHEPQPLPTSNTGLPGFAGRATQSSEEGRLHHAEQAGGSQAFHYIVRNTLRCLNLWSAGLQPAA